MTGNIPADPDTRIDGNKGVVAEFHRRLWDEADFTVIDEVFAADAVVHMTGFDSGAVDSIRDDATRYRGSFTDISTEVVSLMGEGDRVVLHWQTTGRHVGRYGKVEATGKTITMSGIDIFRIAQSRIVECWSMWDGLDVYDQMGVLPDLW
jgi:predicted ester cyclase